MYNDKKNGKIGIIITIIILVFLVIITNLDNAILSKISNPFTKITISVQGGIVYAKNKLSKNNEYFTTLDNLKEQNEQLRAENDQLKNERQEMEVLKAENKTLKEYSKLSEKYSEFSTIPAYVIQKDFSNYSKIIVINVGESDGIKTGMTVVAEGGLVGYVVSVEDKSAKVQTIVDTASAVSAVFDNTEKSLVTRGVLDSSDKIKGNYIDNDVVINEGDKIVTSGIGGIYPKNINIGKIKEIVNTQNKTNRYVYIEPLVDFNNLSDATDANKIKLHNYFVSPPVPLRCLQCNKYLIVAEKNIKYTCNGDLIRQLLGILIDNSIKHTNENGNVTVNLYKSNKDIILEVKNDGDEIKKEDEQKIFERFYKIDESRNRNENRYGLGLAIAKDIVEKHNAKISANSKKGITTFKVTF